MSVDSSYEKQNNSKAMASVGSLLKPKGLSSYSEEKSSSEESHGSSFLLDEVMSSTSESCDLPQPTDQQLWEVNLGESNYDGQRFDHLILRDELVKQAHNNPRELDFNTSEGIPFENEHFKGKVIFKLRPGELKQLKSSDYISFFRKRDRKFELQVQGCFKKPTQGIVWLGAEVGHCDPSRVTEDRMQLSFFRKSMCRLVLSTINLMRGSILHYSFGDSQETPHIMLPLHIAADTFIETDRGQAPPKMGAESIQEDEKAVKLRRKQSKIRKFEPGKTYSFSLHNANLDLYNWELAGMPGVRNQNLRDFWSDMPLRICAYMTDESSKHHTIENKKYLFCFNLKNSKSGSPGGEKR
mmetsp:Transcript_4839/g.9479  ORF Transcript_4839/g.9479 Transcript_4839/m.9479 type:complete len:354 (+) Transcript_4839:36-1097(+)